MKNSKKWLAAGFIIFLSFTAGARAQNIQILTLKRCIDSALHNYPSIKALAKIRESKAAQTKSLRNQTLPELNIVFQSEYNNYRDYEYRVLDNGLQLMWDMGKWAGELEKAGIAEEKIAQYRAQQNKFDIIYQVKHAFYSMISAKRTLRIAKLSKQYLEHHLAVNEQLYSIGQIKRLDYYFTQNQLLGSRGDVLAAQLMAESWQIQLENYTGIIFTVKDSLVEPEKFDFPRDNVLDSLLQVAREFNPAMSILNSRIDLAGVQGALIRNSRLPKVYFGGGYIFDNDPTSGGDYGKISGGLTVPVFDWGARSNMTQFYQIQIESIKSTGQTLLLEIKTKLKSLLNRIDNIKKLLAIKEISIKQAQKTYDLTLINYKAGITTNTDALLAQKALIGSQAAKEKLLFLLFDIQAQIENLIGKPEVTE